MQRKKKCATKNIKLVCAPCAVHDGEGIAGIQAVVSEGVVVVLTIIQSIKNRKRSMPKHIPNRLTYEES